MQINNHLPALFISSKQSNESSIRLPVLFDKSAEINHVSHQPIISRSVTGVTDNKDSQQARFIRNFSLSNREVAGEAAQARLPASVQTYLQIEGLRDNQPQGGVFDAMA